MLTARGELTEAEQWIATLEARGFLEPDAERVKSQLHVRRAAEAGGGVDALTRASAADPQNGSLQIQLAEAHAAAGQVREALETCLHVIQRDRSGAGVAAKAAMLDILKTLDDPDLASEYRRKLASALY